MFSPDGVIRTRPVMILSHSPPAAGLRPGIVELPGFEPRLQASKALVLPLHHSSMENIVHLWFSCNWIPLTSKILTIKIILKFI